MSRSTTPSSPSRQPGLRAPSMGVSRPRGRVAWPARAAAAPDSRQPFRYALGCVRGGRTAEPTRAGSHRNPESVTQDLRRRNESERSATITRDKPSRESFLLPVCAHARALFFEVYNSTPPPYRHTQTRAQVAVSPNVSRAARPTNDSRRLSAPDCAGRHGFRPKTTACARAHHPRARSHPIDQTR
jgi:hypothetical protein